MNISLNKLPALFIVVLLVGLGPGSLAAQPNYPFPTAEDQPVWRVQFGSFFTGTHTVDTFFYSTESPVNACDLQYTPVRERGSSWDAIMGYYRVAGPRVYFRESLACDERDLLLYDFSVEVGDTVFCKYIPTSTSYHKADTIAHVVYRLSLDTSGTLARRIIHLYAIQYISSTLYTYLFTEWIEGVGSVEHPFRPTDCWDGLCEGGSSFKCLQTATGPDYGPGCSPPPRPNRLYVDQHVAPSALQDGRTWATAFADLQDALALASYGDSVWVAQGIYRPTGGTDRHASFKLASGVRLFGGFAGHEQWVTQRDWTANPTLLSGDIGRPDSVEDNSIHILYALGVDSTTVLDGFTVTAGYARDPAGFTERQEGGAGLLVDTDADHPLSAPTIRNCRFVDNQALYGAAIMFYAPLGQTPASISSCEFMNNHGLVSGGAVYAQGKLQLEAGLRFDNCRFRNNNSRGTGGAIACYEVEGTLRLTNCTFTKNKSNDIGGAALFLPATLGTFAPWSVTVDSCLFEENEGAEGALHIFHSSPLANGYIPSVKVSRSTFIRNAAPFHGGGAFFVQSRKTIKIDIDKSIFSENRSLEYGSAIRFKMADTEKSILTIDQTLFHANIVTQSSFIGAVAILPYAGKDVIMNMNAQISNSLFTDNRGALILDRGEQGQLTVDVNNCTFSRHRENLFYQFPSATSTTGPDSYSRLRIRNSLIWEPDLSALRMFLQSAERPLLDMELSHSLLDKNPCPANLPGLHCGDSLLFGLDPLFLDPAAGDFRLAVCSPAINRGDNSFLANGDSLLDLQAAPRIQEDRVDLGAYEQPSDFGLAVADRQSTTCADRADGAVELTTNGQPPYQIEWTSPLWGAGEDGENLLPGDYTFTLTDRHGCRDSISALIQGPEPIAPVYTVRPVSTAGALDGAIQLENISGGVPAYRFLWSTGAVTSTIRDLSSGDYTLTITDQNACHFDTAFTVGVFTPVAEVGNHSWRIYPNPISTPAVLTIELPDSPRQALRQVEIRDVQGKLIASTERLSANDTGAWQWSLPALSPGYYLLIFSDKEGGKTYAPLLVR